jgi:hypothetical protein
MNRLFLQIYMKKNENDKLEKNIEQFKILKNRYFNLIKC